MYELAWDYPANQATSDLVFYLMDSTDQTNWTTVASVPWPTQAAFVTIPPGVYYFQCEASNYTGTNISAVVTATIP